MYNLRDEFKVNCIVYDSPACLCLPKSDSQGIRSSEGAAAEELQAFPPSVESPRTSIRRGCPREVEEGDEASERIVDQETFNAEPSPSSFEKLQHSELRDDNRVRQKSLPSCHERPVLPLLTFPHSRATGLSVLSTRFRPIHVVQIREIARLNGC